MELAVYQYVQETDSAADELPMKALWCGSPPQPGEFVSMGLGERWQVIKLYTFRPVAIGQPVKAIHMVQIAREDLPVPSEDEWTAYQMQRGTPEQAFYLMTDDVGGEILEMGFSCLGDTPAIGTRLYNYELVGEGTRMRPIPRNWWVDRFDTYVCAEESPYRNLYLAYCVTIPVRSESGVE